MVAESARRGWIAFRKDFAIKRHPAEIQAILANGAPAERPSAPDAG